MWDVVVVVVVVVGFVCFVIFSVIFSVFLVTIFNSYFLFFCLLSFIKVDILFFCELGVAKLVESRFRECDNDDDESCVFVSSLSASSARRVDNEDEENNALEFEFDFLRNFDSYSKRVVAVILSSISLRPSGVVAAINATSCSGVSVAKSGNFIAAERRCGTAPK